MLVCYFKQARKKELQCELKKVYTDLELTHGGTSLF